MDLAVRTFGESGHRLLLLHGLGSSAAGWWRVGPALASAGFHVTAPDLRGHGSSPHGDDYSFGAYADDVRKLGSGWDVVIGHSLGGAVAITLCDEEPDYASRLVLLDPAIVIPAPHLVLDELLAAYDAPLTAEQVSADNPTWHPEDSRLKAEALCQSPPAVTTMTVEHNTQWNLVAMVARLTIPTLLVGSDPDLGSLVPPQLGEGLVELNGQIEFVTIPASSHSMHRDEFAPLMEVILGFLT